MANEKPPAICPECGFPKESREHLEGKGLHDGSYVPPEPTLAPVVITITPEELDARIEAKIAESVESLLGPQTPEPFFTDLADGIYSSPAAPKPTARSRRSKKTESPA